MSWSMREPEEPTMCDCKYNEARDEMDREDCPLHFGSVDDVVTPAVGLPVRREPTGTTGNKQEDAA
jgi:hypothetical protein